MTPSDLMSAQLSAIWDWSQNSSSSKESRKQEAFKYSPRRLAQVGGVHSDYPFEVVNTRLRIPGTGRAVTLRYESTEGKDFVLLGHSLSGIERTESEGNK